VTEPLIAISGYEFRGSPSDMLAMFADIGAAAVEVWPRNVASDGVASFRRMLEREHLVASCVSTGAQSRLNSEPVQECRATINASVDLAEAVGAPLVSTYMGENPMLSPSEAIDRFIEGIAPCADRAASRGVTLLVENMFDSRGEDPTGQKPMRTAIGSFETLERLVNHGIRLTFDPCNFAIAGDEPTDAYRLLAPFISNFHVKDAISSATVQEVGDCTWIDSQTGTFVSVATGSGNARLRETIAASITDGFHGPYTVDILTRESDRLDMYKQSVSFLKDVISNQ
jgi:sugar phosphate isomerase/epimerase